MGFSNPRTPWSKLARRLEGKGLPGASDTPDKQGTGRQGTGRPVDKHADGSDAPAFSRPDRYQVSVGPGGSDGRSRYQGPEGAGSAQGPGSGPLLRQSSVDWAELHVHSQFSFLDGASDPEALVGAAALAGLTSLALPDHN